MTEQTQDTTPLVSVVIPTYNRSKELARAIKSVLNQTYQNFEILVVDDGSEEDLRVVCDSFNDQRIKFLRNDTHINANVARNRGIKEAQGEYIAMLDSDDEYLPHHLSRRVEKIKEWNCDGIFGSAYIDNGVEIVTGLSRPVRKNENFTEYLFSDGFAPTPSHFYRKHAAKQIVWDEQILRHQDFDFSIRFADKFHFKVDHYPTIKIHWHPNTFQLLTEAQFRSQQAVFENYKARLTPRTQAQYYLRMLPFAIRANNESFIKIYKSQINNLIKFITLTEFMTTHNCNSLIKKVITRALFVIKILSK